MYNLDSSIIILVTSSEEVPAKALAKLTGYTAPYWSIEKPNAAGISPGCLCVVPEVIPAGGKGVAFVGGIHAVLCTVAPAAGTMMGSKVNSWEATTGGSFPVVITTGGHTYIRLDATGGNTTVLVLQGSRVGNLYRAHPLGSTDLVWCCLRIFTGVDPGDLTNCTVTAWNVGTTYLGDPVWDSWDLPSGLIYLVAAPTGLELCSEL